MLTDGSNQEGWWAPNFDDSHAEKSGRREFNGFGSNRVEQAGHTLPIHLISRSRGDWQGWKINLGSVDRKAVSSREILF